MSTSKTTATTAKKTATTAADAAGPAAVADDAAPAAPSLKKKEFIDRVTLASGAKKKDVKDIVEAVLTVLGDALAKGEELSLPPLGRAKIHRSRELGAGSMIMIKLHRGSGKAGSGTEAKEGLAAAED